jgi:hypothetical protein
MSQHSDEIRFRHMLDHADESHPWGKQGIGGKAEE